MDQACGEVPIVVRATTESFLHPQVVRIAEHNAKVTGAGVVLAGCWQPRSDDIEHRRGASSSAVGTAGLAAHTACSRAWRSTHLRNPQAVMRLARMQPVWAAVDILTSAAAEMVLRTTCYNKGRARRGRGCTAFVVDPDVLLDGDAIRVACRYYAALRFDAVLLFNSPPRTYLSLNATIEDVRTRTREVAAHDHERQHVNTTPQLLRQSADGGIELSSAVTRVMGNRHISFLSLHALSVLSDLSRRFAPTFDLPKGLDMLLPLLLPSQGVETLWALDRTGALIRGHHHPHAGHHHPHAETGRGIRRAAAAFEFEAQSCVPRQLRRLSSTASAPQWACSSARAANAASPPRDSSRGSGSSLLYMFDAFLFMLPGEAASRHVCDLLECLAPWPTAVALPYSPRDRRSLPIMTPRQRCESARGPYRRMPELTMEDGIVYGRLTANASHHPRLRSVDSWRGSRVRLLSIHLQGNAKGACLPFLLQEMQRTRPLARLSPPAPPPSPPWCEPDWAAQTLVARSKLLLLSDVAFIVMTSSHTSANRLAALRATWASDSTPIAITSTIPAGGAPRMMFMSDRDHAETGERTTPALSGRDSYWDAQARHFEGVRLLYETSRRSASTDTLSSSSYPAWTVLVDDDSYVNRRHLLAYLSRFDPDVPLLVGHCLNGVWDQPGALTGLRGGRGRREQGPLPLRSLSGGAGMILSRAALIRFGRELSQGTMPLPSLGISNDVHFVGWAQRLQVRVLHSNLLAYGALPADARVAHTVGRRIGRDLEDYYGSTHGAEARSDFVATAVRSGALDPQLLGAVVLHRVPSEIMRLLHTKIQG